MTVDIIGGVAGGATAAARLRRLDEQAEIVVLERTGYVSYANCGLPYYVGGVIQERSKLTLQTPESFRARFGIDVRVRHEAVAIHPEEHTVTVRRLEDRSEYTETYDKLILSPGAQAVVPPLPGVEDSRVFTLRTVEDTFRLRDYLEERRPKSAVVVGGGFIGLETAENLVHAGVHTTILQRGDQILPPLDADMAHELHAHLRCKGVDLRLGAKVTGFEGAKDGLTVHVEGTEDIPADLVLLAVGVKPESDLARAAGLAVSAKGSIVVDEHMRTSQSDIYAVGDAVEILSTASGRRTMVALAGPANRQGRIAADHICGRDSAYRGPQGTSVLKLFDMTAASTGINEKTAKALGLSTDKVIISPMSHAGYYPGGKMMTMKVLFEKDTYRLLGAQTVGFDGVDKRIDVIATAIRAGMKAYELAELDLAYAPPYSSAKDPVNMAGYIVENIKNGVVKQWYYEDTESLQRDENVTLLDTRTPTEYSRGHVEGFINIPVDELRERIGELDRTKQVYVICQSGLRSYIATRILAGNGFDCYNFAGGFRFYDAVHQEKALNKKSTPCGMEI